MGDRLILNKLNLNQNKQSTPTLLKSVILCITLLSSFFTHSIFSQEETTEKQARLLKHLNEVKQHYQEKNNRIQNYLLTLTDDQKKVLFDDPDKDLIDVIDGLPLFYSIDNKEGGETLGVDKTYSGGTLGLSLSGSGITVGVWDQNSTRVNHQEFTNNRVQMANSQNNNLSNHSTHVSGTIAAAGITDRAKGMAFESSIIVYDWFRDQLEMTNAANNGLQVSNHSYGVPVGWRWNSNQSRHEWLGDASISSFEDNSFGRYSHLASQWDAIAYNYPNYLIVKAAGNDRVNSGPNTNGLTGTNCRTTEQYYLFSTGSFSNVCRERPDGGADGFDSISHSAVAKNILTVGAVRAVRNYVRASDVVMSSFSGFGPVDDGRIKPDLVAKGVNVYSTISNGLYFPLDGTSMASPMITGGIALLLDHQENLYSNVTLKSATVKGLLIHTAKEAGSNPGPDYKFGWGLADIEAAVSHMSSNSTNNAEFIKEDSLNQGQTKDFTVVFDGQGPYKATLVWTDPEHAAVANILDPPTKTLVNDLDLQVIKSSGGTQTTYHPWTLDKNNPSNAAVRSQRNDIDNVEQVLIDDSDTTGGTYTIRVTHTGSITGGSQDFSLILTPVEGSNPPIITAPLGAISTTNMRPRILGTNTSGYSVSLFKQETGGNITSWGSATVSDTSWSFTPPIPNSLSDGTYSIFAKQSLGPDESIFSTQSVQITVDTTAATPDITSHSGVSYINTTTPLFTGTAETGSTVSIYAPPEGQLRSLTNLIGSLTLSTGTTWSAQVSAQNALTNGSTYNIQVNQEDALGNVSPFNTSLTVIVDTDVPNPTVFIRPNLTGVTLTNPITTNNATPDLRFSGETGTTLKLYTDSSGTLTEIFSSPNFDPNNTYNPTLPQGQSIIVAKLLDLAGNLSNASASLHFLLDSLTTAPTITSHAFPLITSENSIALSGDTVSDISSIILRINNGNTIINHTVTLSSTAPTWSHTVPTSSIISDGVYTITLIGTDNAGNTETSPPHQLTIDRTAPSQPSITSPSSPTSTGNRVIPITGSCSDSSHIIQLFNNSTLLPSADSITCNGSTFSYTPPGSGLNDGTYTISAKEVDQSGNASDSNPITLIIDNNVPNPPIILSRSIETCDPK